MPMQLEEKLKELMPSISENQMKKAKLWEELMLPQLRDLRYAPNVNQLGVAIAATLQFATKKRQFWQLPPSAGKSRAISAIVAIFHDVHPEVENIHIVFSS